VVRKPDLPIYNPLLLISMLNRYYCHPIVDGREVASNRNVLPRAVKEFFQNQFFCCYEYEELSTDTEETMFQLVQRGIALTPAEKMRAMSTEWAAFAKQYEDDYVLIVNCKSRKVRFPIYVPLTRELCSIKTEPCLWFPTYSNNLHHGPRGHGQVFQKEEQKC
jgi:hypothetical protein